jgi:hypothetical protein
VATIITGLMMAVAAQVFVRIATSQIAYQIRTRDVICSCLVSFETAVTFAVALASGPAGYSIRYIVIFLPFNREKKEYKSGFYEFEQKIY